jgi:hypothetical protein
MLLLLVGLFLLVNLMAQLGGRVGPAETVVLAAMAVLLIWAAVRSAAAQADRAPGARVGPDREV